MIFPHLIKAITLTVEIVRPRTAKKPLKVINTLSILTAPIMYRPTSNLLDTSWS